MFGANQRGYVNSIEFGDHSRGVNVDYGFNNDEQGDRRNGLGRLAYKIECVLALTGIGCQYGFAVFAPRPETLLEKTRNIPP